MPRYDPNYPISMKMDIAHFPRDAVDSPIAFCICVSRYRGGWWVYEILSKSQPDYAG